MRQSSIWRQCEKTFKDDSARMKNWKLYLHLRRVVFFCLVLCAPSPSDHIKKDNSKMTSLAHIHYCVIIIVIIIVTYGSFSPSIITIYNYKYTHTHTHKTQYQSINPYLQSQNALSAGVYFTCFREYVLPRMLPSQTSNPWSASMYPNESSSHSVTQLVASASNPCCRNTTGLDPFVFTPFFPCGILCTPRMKPSSVVTS